MFQAQRSGKVKCERKRRGEIMRVEKEKESRREGDEVTEDEVQGLRKGMKGRNEGGTGGGRDNNM